MASKDDTSEKGESAKDSGAGGPVNDSPRRHFLMVAMTLGAVFVTAGIASVAKSLFAPSTSPPVPPASPGSTKTVTQTVTSTVQGGQSGSASTSSSSSSSTTSASSSSSSTSSSGATSPFPVVQVANISDLAGGKVISFNYPLEETPNLLVKLGVKAQGGVGPDGDIVAFSQFCQHLGCVYGFVPPGTSPACDNTFKPSTPMGYCCCHGSVFDLANGGKVTDGPSPRPVPQVILSFDASSGSISAIGMTPPSIFGHNTGSSNVSDDLKGGTPVSA